VEKLRSLTTSGTLLTLGCSDWLFAVGATVLKLLLKSGYAIRVLRVHKSRDSKPFVGYGDADPSNVSIQVHGAEMRIAETRAVNRALRKAYGIGICSVEELGCSRTTDSTPNNLRRNHSQRHPNGSNNGQPRLRDQLSVLIRQHNLNPLLVKAYAADFCGTATLSDATRELIESFISHLSTAAKENRDGLLCKLNSYAQPVETQP
jgi:hypothetical protein